MLLAADKLLLDDPNTAPSEISTTAPAAAQNFVTVLSPNDPNAANGNQVTLPDSASSLPDLADLSNTSGQLPGTDSVVLYMTASPDPNSSAPLEVNLTWGTSSAPSDAQLWLFDGSGNVLATIPAANNVLWVVNGFTGTSGQTIYVGISGTSPVDSNGLPATNAFNLQTLNIPTANLYGSSTPAGPVSPITPPTLSPNLVVTALTPPGDTLPLVDSSGQDPSAVSSPPSSSPTVGTSDYGATSGSYSGSQAPSLHALPLASLPPMAGKLGYRNLGRIVPGNEGVAVDLNLISIRSHARSFANKNNRTTNLGARVALPAQSAVFKSGSTWLSPLANREFPGASVLAAEFTVLPNLGLEPEKPQQEVLAEQPHERTGLAVLPAVFLLGENGPHLGDVPPSIFPEQDADRAKEDSTPRGAGRYVARGIGTIAGLSVSANLIFRVLCPDLIAVRRRPLGKSNGKRAKAR